MTNEQIYYSSSDRKNTYCEPVTHAPSFSSLGDADTFNQALSGILDDLKDIILLLSKGIHDSQPNFKGDNFVSSHQYLYLHLPRFSPWRGLRSVKILV